MRKKREKEEKGKREREACPPAFEDQKIKFEP